MSTLLNHTVAGKSREIDGNNLGDATAAAKSQAAATFFRSSTLESVTDITGESDVGSTTHSKRHSRSHAIMAECKPGEVGCPQLNDTDWLSLFASNDEEGFLDDEGVIISDFQPLLDAGFDVDVLVLASAYAFQKSDTVDFDAAASDGMVDAIDGSEIDIVMKQLSYGIKSIAESSLSENDCLSATSHYFGVMQYVTAHFGMVETGVGVLEDVRLEQGDFAGHLGEDDEVHQYNEAEAEAGDANAQMWLGRRYFWGFGGLQPNPLIARRSVLERSPYRQKYLYDTNTK